MSVWITVPTYNESENIRSLLSAILQVLPNGNVVVVDDNSPDGTSEIVSEMAMLDKRIHLVRRSGKLGYASAILTGLNFSSKQGAHILGHMDADFSHDPNRLPAFLEALERGADLAIGSRYVAGGGVKGWSLYRQVLSRGANWLTRTLLSLPIHDCTSGFRLYKRDAFMKLRLHRLKVEGYGFLYLSTALAFWSGLKIAEVPILFIDRRHGKSKLSRRIIAEAATALVKVFVWRKTGRWIGKPLVD
ncbi:MAG: polyprenol monophosphomannose synthase [Armatimonadetes bacterium]|nr:polyprenol monophosphomannose synthase [Armatimonadota bacterium]MDW8028845.1 polyprenol monophosphomannose synthase [Armatimonadota bacterium]